MKKLLILYFFFCVNWQLIAQISTDIQEIEDVSLISSEEPEDTLSFFDWCVRDSITHFTFITNVKKLWKDKKKKEYQPGKLVINTGASMDTFNIKVRPRGNMRQRQCFFPPIKFKITGDQLEDLDLDDIKSYKMVTHCKKARENEQWVYKELVAYKMYSEITDYCFRTHQVVVDYIDEKSKKVIESKVGFVIESPKDLEKRLNGKMVKRTKSHAMTNMAFYVSQMSMFQYMIGNTDWSFYNLHNLKLFKAKDFQYTLPIAYDFDYSGIVNTEYAVPAPQLRIEEVTQRLYRDICQERDTVKKIIHKFISKKQDVINCIYEVKELRKRERNEMLDYIELFYRIIEKPKNLDRIFRSKCDD